MALSYSGIVNYGKVNLPSVESWSTNMNIMKDPPKSVFTRKIDKVGETSAITTAIDQSGDRFCESINYYARGQNPMVSVSYGQGQNASSEAFLPYRIMREGAFRPPIWRQEDLLPLSRLPRIWTEMSTQPYKPIFTKRIVNCGDDQNTKEVKSDMLKLACESAKTVYAYPQINEPDVKSRIIKDQYPITVKSARSCMASDYEFKQNQNRIPVVLHPTRKYTSGYTNIKSIKEDPIVLNNVSLQLNHPVSHATTNFSAPSLSGGNNINDVNYNRLYGMKKGEFEGYKSIPSVEMNHPIKKLIKIR